MVSATRSPTAPAASRTAPVTEEVADEAAREAADATVAAAPDVVAAVADAALRAAPAPAAAALFNVEPAAPRHGIGPRLLGQGLDQCEAAVFHQGDGFAGERRGSQAIAQLAERIGEFDAAGIRLALQASGRGHVTVSFIIRPSRDSEVRVRSGTRSSGLSRF